MFKVNHVGYDITGKNYERVFRPQGSGDYLFLFMLSSFHAAVEKEITVAAPGACILYTPGVKQDYSAMRDFRLSYIHFSIPGAEKSRFSLPENEVFYPKDPALVQQFIEQIFREYNTRDVLCDDQMDSLLRNLFVLLTREAKKEAVEGAFSTKLYPLFLEARCMMLSNCEKEWASTNMCEMVSLSRSQFYKYYEEFFGLSPMADINRARIEKAKALLTNEEMTVTEISAMCGYQSIHHFSRTFKQHTGMSPLQFAKAVTKH